MIPGQDYTTVEFEDQHLRRLDQLSCNIFLEKVKIPSIKPHFSH